MVLDGSFGASFLRHLRFIRSIRQNFLTLVREYSVNAVCYVTVYSCKNRACIFLRQYHCSVISAFRRQYNSSMGYRLIHIQVQTTDRIALLFQIRGTMLCFCVLGDESRMVTMTVLHTTLLSSMIAMAAATCK